MRVEGTGNIECMVTVLKLISYALEFSHVLEDNYFPSFFYSFQSVQFTRSVVSDSLRPHES